METLTHTTIEDKFAITRVAKSVCSQIYYSNASNLESPEYKLVYVTLLHEFNKRQVLTEVKLHVLENKMIWESNTLAIRPQYQHHFKETGRKVGLNDKLLVLRNEIVQYLQKYESDILARFEV